MKLKKILVTLVFILAVIAFVFMIHKHSLLNRLTLQPIGHPSIVLNEDDKLFFFEGGFAISGQNLTTFFNTEGFPVEMPFNLEDELNQNFTITDMTSNFVLINNNSIYKKNGANLLPIYSLDYSAIKIIEYGKYLLILEDLPDEGVEVKILNIENGNLTDLDFDENFYFMDLDSTSDDSSLSILTLDINGTFPSSKVLHYDHNLSLFAINTNIDKFYYKIFRLPSFSILIGNRELVCYNVEGEEIWKLENNLIDNFQVVRNDSEALIYLDGNLGKVQEQPYNGVYIDQKGERHNIKFPSNLTNICLYKNNKFLGLQHGKKLLIFDKKGNVELELYIEEDIKSIFWNHHHPNNFFIVNLDGELKIYSIEQEDLL